MVNLLTDYSTQIYHALSTDARPAANPGDQLREIDTGKRFIFDGSAWNELPDGGGGGGGAKVLTKIAEAEITSPVSAVTFPLTLFDNVDFFYLNIVGVVMSASDYIYFRLDNDNIGYTGKSATHNHKEIITIAPSISLDGVNWPKKACLAAYTAATTYVGVQTAGKTNFVCAAYTSATMQSGKIEIWGYV